MRLAFRAAALVVLFCVAAVHPAGAQQQGAGDAHDYKPPARFIADEPAATGAVKAAPSRPAASAAATAPVKTIGLISVLGESFTVKKVGVMVFNNEEHRIPIAGWKINEQVAALVARRLRKTFKVKPIRVPDGAFERFGTGGFSLFSSRSETLGKFVAEHAASQPCDYYLLVAPGGDRVGSSNQDVSGLGILRLDGMFGASEFIHAYASLQVYDSKFAPLRSEDDVNIKLSIVADVLRGPHVEMKEGNRLPPDPQAAVADPRTRKIASELLEKSLAMTLPKLFATD